MIADENIARKVVERLHYATEQVGCALIVTVNHPLGEDETKAAANTAA